MSNIANGMSLSLMVVLKNILRAEPPRRLTLLFFHATKLVGPLNHFWEEWVIYSAKQLTHFLCDVLQGTRSLGDAGGAMLGGSLPMRAHNRSHFGDHS